MAAARARRTAPTKKSSKNVRGGRKKTGRRIRPATIDPTAADGTAVRSDIDDNGNGGGRSDDSRSRPGCSHCRSSSSSSTTVRFRPLVGSEGDFLCDPCYLELFPATAMVDNERPDPRHSSRLESIRLSAASAARSVAAAAGAKGRKSNASADDNYPEEEECRLCLDRGHHRPCCSKYYCHDCYHRTGQCPGCGAAVCTTGIAARNRRTTGGGGDDDDDPSRFSIACSWFLSVWTVLIIVGVAAAWAVNERTAPETVWGHRCRGWFPTCDVEACVEYGPAAATTSAVEKWKEGRHDDEEADTFNRGLPPSQPYRRCRASTTITRVVGLACVFDKELYRWTGGERGYDFCYDAPREGGEDEREETGRVDGDPTASLLVQRHGQADGGGGGAFVFDDDFNQYDVDSNRTDFPAGLTAMASARWSEVRNGEVSDVCGANDRAPMRGWHVPDDDDGADDHDGNASSANRALVFSGVHGRYAATADLDVRFGGHLDFFLKFGPVIPNDDGGSARCKTAYAGDVVLEYATDGGESWHAFATYPVWRYRGSDFARLREPLPRLAWSNATRVRFRQPSFDARRDYWALDDVRVFRNFRRKWRGSDEYRRMRKGQKHAVEAEQCCLDTEQCYQLMTKTSYGEETAVNDLCASLMEEVKSSHTGIRLKSSDWFVLLACLLSILKMLYRHLYRRIIVRSTSMDVHEQCRLSRKGKNVQKNSSADVVTFPRQEFHPIVHASWQTFVLAILIMPLGLGAFRIIKGVGVTACFSQSAGVPNEILRRMCSAKIIICILALLVDFREVRHLLKTVFGLGRCCCCSVSTHTPVIIDTHPDCSSLFIGRQVIPLMEVTSVQRRTRGFVWVVSLCHIFGGFPYASGGMVLRTFGLPHDVLRICGRTVGSIAMARAIVGPDLFVKTYLVAEWLFSLSSKPRIDMGKVLERGRLRRCTTFNSNVFILGAAVFALVHNGYSSTTMTDKITTGIASVFLGGFFGALSDMFFGLPCTPEMYLTRWPTGTQCVTYFDKAKCPCLYSCVCCGDLHSGEKLVVVHLDDMYTYRKLLRGDWGSRRLSK